MYPGMHCSIYITALFIKMAFQRTLPSHSGSIWCIAANPASTILAIGCEDGAIRLLSLEADTLTHLRRLDRVKSRILSLAWGPPIPRQTSQQARADESSDDDDVEDWSDSWIVAGCSDSSLRKWDVPTGRVGEKMSTDKMRGERTLVWTVGVLGCVHMRVDIPIQITHGNVVMAQSYLETL